MVNQQRICFISNDSWFFFRHFGPAIAAALSKRFNVSAYLPPLGVHAYRAHHQVEIISSPIERHSSSPLSLIHQATWLVWRIRRDRPQIVVAFSLRVSLALALALPFVRIPRVIFSITGLGLLAIIKDRRSQFLRQITYKIMRVVSVRENCFFIFENQSDMKTMGLGPEHAIRKRLLVGAGVDTSEFFPASFPPSVPFKVASVSRLVWSKGVDLAVLAVSQLAEEGHSIVLSIYGAPDRANPRSFDPKAWKEKPGIVFEGYTDDIRGIWAQHHAGIFPSRGGEGLPRSLLEAAACGRPCIVTDVPGCADFIRDGIDGYVVQAGSVVELKEAIKRLMSMSSSDRLSTLGCSARERVLKTSTVERIQEQYEELFDLSQP